MLQSATSLFYRQVLSGYESRSEAGTLADARGSELSLEGSVMLGPQPFQTWTVTYTTSG